jgi:glycosyltransferase involved in cell wall biosynthesis
MPSKVICYFQETEPNSSAVAIRAKYFIKSIQKNLSSKIRKIQIITATEDSNANEVGDVEYIRFSVGKTAEGVSPHTRIFAEILFGARSLLWFFFNYRDSVLIISSPNYLPSIILAASAKLLKVKYILDIRDAYPEAYAQSGLISTSSMVYKLFLAASNFMYNNASAISVATEGLRKNIPSPLCDITTIFNGFPSFLISSTAKKHNNFTICFHGVMGYFQDIEKLIEVIEHPDLSEIDFIVIGYGRKSGLFRSLKRENCQFLGRLSHSETMHQVSMCHMGISIRVNNAISQDSFPVKVWEYIGLGIPSLVYPESEAGEFLLSKNCGVQLSSNNVDDIACILLNIKSNKLLYEGMVDSCRAVRESYTRENISCNFSKIIENVLKDS